MIELNKIYQGNTLDVLKPWPDAFVDCVITSPPYWGLRAYGTEPQIWDGDPNCQHIWIDNSYVRNNDQTAGEKQRTNTGSVGRDVPVKSGFCQSCNAWKGELGLEPTFDLYISHLIQIFDEVKRVLKPTGTCWVNLGDSYHNATKWTNKPECPQTISNGNNRDLKTGRVTNQGIGEKSLCCIPDRFKIAMVDSGWICRNEIVWYKRNCLNGGTILYASTQRGVMPSTIKDLVRLKPETVQLWDGGKWQKVKEWVRNKNPQNIKDITFRNGETITCTGDHLFPLISGDIKKTSELIVGDVIKKTQFTAEEKTVECIPDEMGWLIGTYLADGSVGAKDGCLQFSSHKKEQDRFARLKEIAKKYDANCYAFYKEGNTATFNISSKILIAIIRTYVGGRIARNKHLTNAVWLRSDCFLKSLLAGYLDGDGHYEEENDRYRLGFCRNNDLARDLRLLCARLGYSIKLQKGKVLLNGKEFKKYGGEIRLKKKEYRTSKHDSEIVTIRSGKNTGNFWDIVLEQEPHLFATHSGILLHNCMPSSASDRFTVDFEKIFFFTKQGKYWFEQQFEPHQECFIKARASKLNQTTDPGAGMSAVNVQLGEEPRGTRFVPLQGRNMRTVWQINTSGYKEAHFATFPLELPRRCIAAGCPKEVCPKCGLAREKIYQETGNLIGMSGYGSKTAVHQGVSPTSSLLTKKVKEKIATGYTDCGCGSGYQGGGMSGFIYGFGDHRSCRQEAEPQLSRN